MNKEKAHQAFGGLLFLLLLPFSGICPIHILIGAELLSMWSEGRVECPPYEDKPPSIVAFLSLWLKYMHPDS
jgi:hypothetical protein